MARTCSTAPLRGQSVSPDLGSYPAPIYGPLLDVIHTNTSANTTSRVYLMPPAVLCHGMTRPCILLRQICKMGASIKPLLEIKRRETQLLSGGARLYHNIPPTTCKVHSQTQHGNVDNHPIQISLGGVAFNKIGEKMGI